MTAFFAQPVQPSSEFESAPEHRAQIARILTPAPKDDERFQDDEPVSKKPRTDDKNKAAPGDDNTDLESGDDKTK